MTLQGQIIMATLCVSMGLMCHGYRLLARRLYRAEYRVTDLEHDGSQYESRGNTAHKKEETT